MSRIFGSYPDREIKTDPQVDPAQSEHSMSMRYLVRALIKYNASDLHIKVGRPPLYRINHKLVPAKMPQLNRDQVESILTGILSERQIDELRRKRQIDLSFQMGDYGRFRCSVYFQKDTLAAVVRMIPMTLPSFEELGIPVVLKDLCARRRGLLLVTGATGAGKSTTLSAIVQHINESRHVHILTIEDPIEFVYKDQKSSITQREVGHDTHSFQEGLYAGLRQDPDVIVIGEMRDPDVIRTALTAAETGHLVISTLHTNNVKNTIERILDVFPGDVRNQVRIELASTLVGITSQQLIVKADGSGSVVASEVMVKSPAIEGLILRNEVHQIPEAISNSSNYYKMQTLNKDLERLVRKGLICIEDALKASDNPDDLQLTLQGIVHDEGYKRQSA